VDNPEERITASVEQTVRLLVAILIDTTISALQATLFCGVLYSLSPFMLYFSLAYCAVDILITTVLIGPSVRHIKTAAAYTEADLRYLLTRVRENAEEIAFLNGGDRERGAADTVFKRALALTLRLVRIEAILDAYLRGSMWVAGMMPIFLMAPQFFAGDIKYVKERALLLLLLLLPRPRAAAAAAATTTTTLLLPITPAAPAATPTTTTTATTTTTITTN